MGKFGGKATWFREIITSKPPVATMYPEPEHAAQPLQVFHVHLALHDCARVLHHDSQMPVLMPSLVVRTAAVNAACAHEWQLN